MDSNAPKDLPVRFDEIYRETEPIAVIKLQPKPDLLWINPNYEQQFQKQWPTSQTKRRPVLRKSLEDKRKISRVSRCISIDRFYQVKPQTSI
jgi:hypothetical protein